MTTTTVPKAFASKSQRKAYRKSLRGKVANSLADREHRKNSKADFYRNLRMIKLRRRDIAKAVDELVLSLDRMTRDCDRVADRIPRISRDVTDGAAICAVTARHRVSVVSADAWKFARKRVFYDKKKAA